ncbi:MAG TPA: SRPBCC family protein [Daejeonella sp.]|nr:SRPBCC family protein [Daejeonella sp.]
MKFLKFLLIIIVVLVAIFFIGGLFLPKSYSVSRSTIIKAPDSVVYKNISDFHQFLKWNPWTQKEPSAKVEISGTVGQPGHLYKWHGKDSGEGFMEIKSAQPFSMIDFQLNFIKPWESQAENSFALEKVDEGTKVTWNMQGEARSTKEKWLFLNTDMMIGKDFEDGLSNLKELSEKGY